MLDTVVLCWLLMQAVTCVGQADLPEGIILMAQDQKYGYTDAIKLTRPDGTPVWVNPHLIAAVRSPMAGESGKTILQFSAGSKQAVMESTDEIIALMKARSEEDQRRREEMLKESK